MQMYLIKSGPGCGKSTLMKRLAVKAEQKGEPIQRIHCASDPDSLDGVIFLDKRAAIVDATAPHVMEPDAPGAEEQVVSLYHTLDADALHAHADEVKRLFAQNTALRSRAARYIASAGSLLLDSRRLRRAVPTSRSPPLRQAALRPDSPPPARGGLGQRRAAAAVGHHAERAGLLPRHRTGAGRPVCGLP